MTDQQTAVAVVDRQLDAYNAHDVDAFAETYAEHVRIERRDGSVLEGREAVRQSYAPRFAAGGFHAEILTRIAEGEWVVDHELAHGVGADGGDVRVIVAYRVRDGLIDLVKFLG